MGGEDSVLVRGSSFVIQKTRGDREHQSLKIKISPHW